MTTTAEPSTASAPAAEVVADPNIELVELKDKMLHLQNVRDKIKTQHASITTQEKAVSTAKDRLKTLENELDDLYVEMCEIIDGPGPQGSLPFPKTGGINNGAAGEKYGYPDGPWKDTSVDALGLSDAITEKIKAAGCATIGILVARVKDAPKETGYRIISGIGEKSAQKIADHVDNVILGKKTAEKDPAITQDTDGVPVVPLPGQTAEAVIEEPKVEPTKYDYATTWPTPHNPERVPELGVERYVKHMLEKIKPLVKKQLALEKILFSGIDPKTGQKAAEPVRFTADIQGEILPVEQEINAIAGDYAGYFSFEDKDDLVKHVKNLLLAEPAVG